MKARWIAALALLAGLGWAAARPSEPWTSDLELSVARGATLVVLVAAENRPLGDEARAAVDEAWSTLRPRAERVLLRQSTPRLGRPSALGLFVFASGQLVARRDGPIDAALAKEWLGEALEAASSAARRAHAAELGVEALYAHARLALRLGEIEGAEREFTVLASCAKPPLGASANGWLARLKIERGDVLGARAHFALANQAAAEQVTSADLLLTRGLIESAEREMQAACESFRGAARAFEPLDRAEAERARLELARSLATSGEVSLALETLDLLARSSASNSMRQQARQRADELRVPPVSH